MAWQFPWHLCRAGLALSRGGEGTGLWSAPSGAFKAGGALGEPALGGTVADRSDPGETPPDTCSNCRWATVSLLRVSFFTVFFVFFKGCSLLSGRSLALRHSTPASLRSLR